MTTDRDLPASGRPRKKSTRAPSQRQTRKRYIETSALLSALLENDQDAKKAIRSPGLWITSALTLAEAGRAVIRARATGRIDAAGERAAMRGVQTFARRCEIVAVSEEVLERVARPFPIEPIRTLDAIHIATAELLGDPPSLMRFITRDKRVADNARALGYQVEEKTFIGRGPKMIESSDDIVGPIAPDWEVGDDI